MAFSMMNDGGLVATCEADPTAMVIHYLMRWIANKPVAFYDPTVNIGEGKLILAHCTSPTRMRGFNEQPFRYIATTHHESNTSVAPKVLYEPGIVTTTVKLRLFRVVFIGGWVCLKFWPIGQYVCFWLSFNLPCLFAFLGVWVGASGRGFSCLG
jgi:L-fucose isomerase-like protein